MSGVTDLDELLATMEPALVAGSFVYASVQASDIAAHLARGPIGLFREEEGITLILPADAADGLSASGPMRMITLTVHSSLEAVGLTAAFATDQRGHQRQCGCRLPSRPYIRAGAGRRTGARNAAGAIPRGA